MDQTADPIRPDRNTPQPPAGQVPNSSNESAELVEVSAQKIILVHGTFAHAELDAGDGWWQLGGKCRTYLDERLTGVAACEELRVFHWSGFNNEQAREAAAESLKCELSRMEQAKVSYHIVGHSHGGSVIWRALQLCGSKRLAYLRTWTTLGTPFLHSRFDRAQLWVLLPFVLGTAAAAAILCAAPGFLEVRRELLAVDPWIAWAAVLVLSLFAAAYLVCGVQFAKVVRTAISAKNRETAAAAAWNSYGALWRGFWSRQDEAINGLQSSVGLRHDIVVRDATLAAAAQPQSAAVTTPAPAQSQQQARPTVSPLTRLWNLLVGRPIDSFVWRIIRAFLQGDRPLGATFVDSVTNGPVGNCPELNQLSIDDDDRIRSAADLQLAKECPSLRPALAQAAVADDSIGALVGALGGNLSASSLIHCLYTADDAILGRLEQIVRNGSAIPQPMEPPKIVSPRPKAPPSAYLRIAAAGAACAFAVAAALVFLLGKAAAPYLLSTAKSDALNNGKEVFAIMLKTDDQYRAGDWIKSLADLGYLEEATSEAKSLTDPKLRQVTWMTIAKVHLAQGRFKDAQSALHEAVVNLGRRKLRAKDTASDLYVDETNLLSMIQQCRTIEPTALTDDRAALLKLIDRDREPAEGLASLLLEHLEPNDKQQSDLLKESWERQSGDMLQSSIIIFQAVRLGEGDLARTWVGETVQRIKALPMSKRAPYYTQLAFAVQNLKDKKLTAELTALRDESVSATPRDVVESSRKAAIPYVLASQGKWLDAIEQAEKIADANQRCQTLFSLALQLQGSKDRSAALVSRIYGGARLAALSAPLDARAALCCQIVSQEANEADAAPLTKAFVECMAHLNSNTVELQNACFVAFAQMLCGDAAKQTQAVLEIDGVLAREAKSLSPLNITMAKLVAYVCADDTARDDRFAEAIGAIKTLPVKDHTYASTLIDLFLQGIWAHNEGSVRIDAIRDALHSAEANSARLSLLVSLAQGLGRAGDKTNAARAADALLDEPGFGAQIIEGNIQSEVAQAYIDADYFRTAIQQSRYLDPPDRLKVLAAVLRALQER